MFQQHNVTAKTKFVKLDGVSLSEYNINERFSQLLILWDKKKKTSEHLYLKHNQ